MAHISPPKWLNPLQISHSFIRAPKLSSSSKVLFSQISSYKTRMGFELLEFILERVYDLLKNEASILLEDEKELIQSLQVELELIESYLKDMDDVQRKATLNNVLQSKLQHLVQIIPDVEDFLDNLINQKVQQSHRKTDRIKGFFSRKSNPLILKHRLVERIKQIRETLSDTLQRPEGFQLPNNFSQVISRKRLLTNSSILKDEIIVGLEEDVETLVANFIGKDGNHPRNSSIVGMGGSGKTTLVKKFYNHSEIKQAFSKRAWVCVSQEWNTDELLVQICAMLGVHLLEDEKKIPRFKIQKFFEEEEGSCLVVLDDVWEKNALQELLPTLLSGNGRVLITTRKEKIVKFPRIGGFYIHKARRLTPDQSWELFSRIIHNSCDGVINIEDGDYVRVGKEMLAKCDGLPLAIITLAGLLGTKCTIQQWESIKNRVISVMMTDDNEAVKKVLELSYFDLPYYFKPCFLYLGSFAEDVDIRAGELIRLWIDEGFIKGDQCPDSRRLEEVGMGILEELVQRCMVQVSSRNYAGDISFVRIHDLMRDFCLDKAKELGFFQVLSTSTTSGAINIQPQYHRAVIHKRDTFLLNNLRLRTLTWRNLIPQNQLQNELLPFEQLKQLRVMCLEYVELGNSAKHIGNMPLLRYLRLLECKYKIENMDFIKKLRNLHTFIIQDYSGSLPTFSDNTLSSIEHLRYVYLYSSTNNLNTSLLGVSNSRNLQFLNTSSGQWLVHELESINTDLKELYLYRIKSQPQLDAIYNCVSKTLTHLESLTLMLNPKDQLELAFDLKKMNLERCQLLKGVYLDGEIINQHEPLLFPSKLLLLSLHNTRIEEEEVMKKVIARLDHLRELLLFEDSYIGDKLTIVGLPQLQKLALFCLPNVKECEITRCALPQLRQLDIKGCKKLERVPEEIMNICTLQLLKVDRMSESFCRRIQDGGEDFPLVQHIPTVEFRYIR